MVISSLEGERSRKLRPYDRARCTLVYLRKRDILQQIAAGFGIGVATAWRYVNDTIERLAAFAPSLTETLTSHHCDGFVLLDGTVVETDRVEAEGHFSGKVRREGVNLQVIIDTCTQLDLEVLADKGYQGAGGTVTTPIKRRPDTELPDKHKKSNKVHAALRAPLNAPSPGSRAGGSSAMPASARTGSRQPPRPSPPSRSTREKGSRNGSPRPHCSGNQCTCTSIAAEGQRPTASATEPF
ncbi:transposase family protein [Streptomyces olivoreticuli]|uniref:transposase family protein n=1 Tax=Streptomyces olivoreticuli TaxID=68246 RepID=UPI003F5CCCC2